MITAVSEATVPKISVIMRKAYGAGLYAMSGPAFAPDSCIALPSAHIAVMGPEPAVNAVFANKIAAIEDPDERQAYINERLVEYEADVDLLRLASDLVIDAIVEPEDLRTEIIERLLAAVGEEPILLGAPPRRTARLALSVVFEDHCLLRTAVDGETSRGDLRRVGLVDEHPAVAVFVVGEQLGCKVVAAAMPGAALGIDAQLHVSMVPVTNAQWSRREGDSLPDVSARR